MSSFRDRFKYQPNIFNKERRVCVYVCEVSQAKYHLEYFRG